MNANNIDSGSDLNRVNSLGSTINFKKKKYNDFYNNTEDRDLAEHVVKNPMK